MARVRAHHARLRKQRHARNMAHRRKLALRRARAKRAANRARRARQQAQARLKAAASRRKKLIAQMNLRHAKKMEKYKKKMARKAKARMKRAKDKEKANKKAKEKEKKRAKAKAHEERRSKSACVKTCPKACKSELGETAAQDGAEMVEVTGDPATIMNAAHKKAAELSNEEKKFMKESHELDIKKNHQLRKAAEAQLEKKIAAQEKTFAKAKKDSAQRLHEKGQLVIKHMKAAAGHKANEISSKRILTSKMCEVKCEKRCNKAQP